MTRGTGKRRELRVGGPEFSLELLRLGHIWLALIAVLKINLRTDQKNDFTHGAA